MPDDLLNVNTDRGLIKLKRIIKKCTEEIKYIHSKGFAAISSSLERNIFRGMYTTVDQLFERYTSAWEEATEYSDSHELDPSFPSSEEENKDREVKNVYYEIKAFHLQIAAKAPNPPRPSGIMDQSLANQSVFHPAGHRTILPKILIHKFEGDITKWPSFKQLFTSLVKEDVSLSDTERFHYLTGFLGGPAYDVIRHIAVVEENFNQAWQALEKVYDDPRRLASSYLERFLSYRPPSGKPTVESLQGYLSSVTESILSLQNLPIPNLSEYLLCELSLRSLDLHTRELFETSVAGTRFPQFTELRDFVQRRVSVLRVTQGISPTSEPAKPNPKPFKAPNRFSPRTKPNSHQALMACSNEKPQPKAVVPSSPVPPCFLCQETHSVRDCSKFVSATPAQRLNLLRRFPGCRNCIRSTHKTKDCSSSFSCRICQKRHHTDLHLPVEDLPASADTNGQTPANLEKSKSAGFSGASINQHAGVLLGTIVARIQGSEGKTHTFRGLLDPGSHYSFLTERAARQLGPGVRPFRGAISGVNDSALSGIKGKLTITFLPRSNGTPLETEAVIVPTITPPLPHTYLESIMWEDYLSYSLSDPKFMEPGRISFLIGADLFPQVTTGAPISIHADGPHLMATVFGYTVIGKYYTESDSARSVSLLALSDMPELMHRFWEMEEPSHPPSLSIEDEKCERQFLETHYRDQNGRYVVSLPFKSDPPEMTPNTQRVLNRFYSLENRFAKDPLLRQEYSAQMKEYLELGHMRPATSPARYLIPHHGVFKVEGLKRKLRVVFDASFPTRSGSLNDHLLTGPKLQADIGDILTQFRRFRYVLRCDIVKMFRQIWLNPADRCYQQIAWRESPKDPIQFYELTTVAFGLASSPFLAMRVLRQHAQTYQDVYPDAAAAILNSTYIDDIVTGSDSLEKLCDIKSQLIGLLKEGGFELSKWSSNHPEPLGSTDIMDGPIALYVGDTRATKILGMQWDPATDGFSFDTSSPPEGSTKRVIMSTIARLYDPLGLLAPVIYFAKCLMQRTWQLKLEWDEEVPSDIQESWRRFVAELPKVSSILIPRPFPRSDTTYQLVCFCDASSSGYCAIAYLRATSGSSASLALIKSKTKVAPLKTQTIPRLELCGALLLARLIQSLESVIAEMGITEIFCFTDSTVVLAWLGTSPHRLQMFVSNRVQQILTHTRTEWWHHVKGAENPADVGSRGILPASLERHQLWWSGPEWCSRPVDRWPIINEPAPREIPELKPLCLTLVSVTKDRELVDYAGRHSSYARFVRVIAYMRRFIHNSKIPKARKSTRLIGSVTSAEFTEANHHYIGILQRFYFPEVFTGTPFNALKLELRRLNVFVDPEGLLRVGGRLDKAPLSFEQKHPILLPSRSFYTNLVIHHFHTRNHHVGPSAILAAIRLQFWIPNARNLIKLLKRRCVVCTRHSRAAVVPYMGSLPSSRFSSVRPFLVTGTDFAGPFLCKTSSLRRAPSEKVYLCLFLCMSSRALHLEVATSLSVEGFLDVFDRFIARRGLPEQMLSDGATNYHGTDRYLRELTQFYASEDAQSKIIQHTAPLNVSWSFNPPSSPHFGGGWEVSVRVVKDLLYKTLGNHSYTLPELITAFTKIEGILNSRPLQAQSASPDDLDPLTPGHFLIGQPLNALPEPDLHDIPTNRLNRWQLVRERVQYFWRRWKDEYLSDLQQRQKWNKKTPNLKTGDIVLLRDEDVPPAKWPIGRVMEVHPGSDGSVRVVTLRTPQGTYTRPAIKMVLLTLEDIHA